MRAVSVSRYEYIGIVHLNDAYGQAYAEALTQEASNLDTPISVTSRGFSSLDQASIEIALQRMQEAR